MVPILQSVFGGHAEVNQVNLVETQPLQPIADLSILQFVQIGMVTDENIIGLEIVVDVPIFVHDLQAPEQLDPDFNNRADRQLILP